MTISIRTERDPFDPLAVPMPPCDPPRGDSNISAKHLLRPDGVFLSHDKAVKLDQWVEKLIAEKTSNNAGAKLTMIVPRELVKCGQKVLRGSINTVSSIMSTRAEATRYRAFYNANDTAYRLVVATETYSTATTSDTYVKAGDTVTGGTERNEYMDALACHPRCDLVLRFYKKDICDTFAVCVSLTDMNMWDRYTGVETMSVTFQWLPLIPGALMPSFLRPCSVASLVSSNVNSPAEKREGCVWPGVKMGVPYVHVVDEGWRRASGKAVVTQRQEAVAANPGLEVFAKCMVPLSHIPIESTLLAWGSPPPLGDISDGGEDDWMDCL